MNAKLKAALHAIVSLGGNGMIFEMVPADWKPVSFLVFNLLQVLYAFFDPTYAVQMLGRNNKSLQ